MSVLAHVPWYMPDEPSLCLRLILKLKHSLDFMNAHAICIMSHTPHSAALHSHTLFYAYVEPIHTYMHAYIKVSQ